MAQWKTPSLRVGPRLGLAALLFLVPIVYLVWLVTSEQKVAISFAAKEVDGARYELGEGDAYRFDSLKPHAFRNVGEGELIIVSACTPPTF